MNTIRTALLGFVATFAANVTAQTQDRQDLLSPPTAFDANTGVAPLPDGWHVGGRHYEARLQPGRVTFVPAFGSRAARTMPVVWSLRAIRRGSTTLQEASAGRPPERAGNRITYTHGHGISERYDVRVEGLEQSFAFADPLAGDGDLVVQFDVDTGLAADVGNNGKPRWTLPGIGAVTLGAVTGIDAKGLRVAGTARIDGPRLELALPAAFVASASYPLVLDPLIGVEFDPTAAGNSDSTPDVAYDATNDKFLIVWRRVFSGIDSGIRAQRLNGDGSLVGGTLFPTLDTSHKSNMRVANVNATDRFLVTWEQAALPAGPRNIRGLLINASDGVSTAAIDLVASADDEHSPGLMGEATTGDDEAVLVWQDSGGIKARQVTVPAAGDPIPVGAAVTVASGAVGNAAISKSDGSTGRGAIAWVDSSGPDSEIMVRGITKDAVLIGAAAIAATSNGRPDERPAIDGNGSAFLLVWQQAETAAPPFDIRCRGVSVTATATAMTGIERAIDARVGQNQVDPDVCWLGSKYGVFWQRQRDGWADEVEGFLVNPDCTTCGARFFLDGLNPTGTHNYEYLPRCIGRVAGNPSSGDDGLVVFTEAENAPPFDGNLIAQRFEALGPGTAAVVLGAGCGAGGTIGSAGGPFVVGNPSFRWTLTGISASAIPFFSIAFPGAPLACGSCGLTNAISIEFIGNAGGSATRNYPLSCDPVYVGLNLEVQWVTFNTAANPCGSAAPGLSASQRLRYTLGL
ncbi:MAG: hypothetical protein IPK26_16175 [Planctomycetes bacterium]|nr:hypothetical protein [Planctomycetota bacterium]